MKDSRNFWDKQAKGFNENSDQPSIDLVNKCLKYINEDDIVLDFACGTGGSTRALGQYSKKVYGIDYSSEMIRLASQNSANPANIEYNTSTIAEEVRKDLKYDVLTAFNVLHLVDDLPSLLRHIEKILKPGGVFISFSPCHNKKNLIANTIRLITKLPFLPSVNLLSKDELIENLNEIGFKELEAASTSDSISNLFLVMKKN